jgi:hypothetical protein
MTVAPNQYVPPTPYSPNTQAVVREYIGNPAAYDPNNYIIPLTRAQLQAAYPNPYDWGFHYPPINRNTGTVMDVVPSHSRYNNGYGPSPYVPHRGNNYQPKPFPNNSNINQLIGQQIQTAIHQLAANPQMNQQIASPTLDQNLVQLLLAQQKLNANKNNKNKKTVKMIAASDNTDNESQEENALSLNALSMMMDQNSQDMDNFLN